MRSQRFCALLALLLSAVCHFTVLANENPVLDKNDTYSGDTLQSFSGENGTEGLLSTHLPDVSAHEDFENDGDLSSSGYLPLDDSINVQPVIKPKKGKERKKKVTSSSNSKKVNKNEDGKRKKNFCETDTYRDFCIHGECLYLEHLQQVTCRCQTGYFGERCGLQLMKTRTETEDTDSSATALAILAFVLSTISLIAIIIAITVRVGKQNPSLYEGETEEQEKLQQHISASV
ncbi:amphiregulin [Protopterus annectens]|uniref:amphiregulin n=1 Tax=Protopterus annectens TaxID=7888 RepID=UPI001CFB4B6C|nr:amphiregulin [Protopterus annectens]